MKNLLYHGSCRKIKILKPREPYKETKGIYATSVKKYALMMALTNNKSSSFRSHDKMKINFVKGGPKKYAYLYYLPDSNFKLLKKDKLIDEWVSKKEIMPLKVDKIKTSKLKNLWRKSNKHELGEFLKDRGGWRTPR